MSIQFRDPILPALSPVRDNSSVDNGNRPLPASFTAVSLWPSGKKPIDCEGCPYANRTDPFVAGFGNLAGHHIILGEKPGACEEGTCKCKPGSHEILKPFIGPSGQKINVGLKGDRSDCYITNVRKCNAYDDNKETKAASIKHCVGAYLQTEMDAISAAQRASGIKNAVISPVGADATRVLFGRGGMDSLHGTVWNRREVDAMMDEAERQGITFDEEDENSEGEQDGARDYLG